MSDEEFASYKEEIVSIREAIIVELSKPKEEIADEEIPAEETADEEIPAKEEIAEEEEETPPAKVDPGQAVSAALNFEIFPSDDMKSKYQSMGKAMANLMVDKKND